MHETAKLRRRIEGRNEPVESTQHLSVTGEVINHPKSYAGREECQTQRWKCELQLRSQMQFSPEVFEVQLHGDSKHYAFRCKISVCHSLNEIHFFAEEF